MDSSDEKPLVIKQGDDDMNYQQAYSQKSVEIALKNVLMLAEQQLKSTAYFEQADRMISQDSIHLVREYFLHSGEAVNNNYNVAKDNK